MQCAAATTHPVRHASLLARPSAPLAAARAIHVSGMKHRGTIFVNSTRIGARVVSFRRISPALVATKVAVSFLGKRTVSTTIPTARTQATYHGKVIGTGMKFGIVVGRFNDLVTKLLLEGRSRGGDVSVLEPAAKLRCCFRSPPLSTLPCLCLFSQ